MTQETTVSNSIKKKPSDHVSTVFHKAKKKELNDNLT
jgi:hypothetical protein